MTSISSARPMPAEPAIAVGAAAERSSLDFILRPLKTFLDDPRITELCINRPHALFLETGLGWIEENVRALDLLWCQSFAKLVANATRQRIDETAPLLSASLPSGERVQIVYPPATTLGTVAITIRRPSRETWTVAELARRGVFQPLARTARRPEARERLVARLVEADYEGFMREAVATRQNILVSGPTGSGKTTWTKALIREIDRSERLITIEDAAELGLDRHPNHVRLYYSKDDQGLARVTPKQLLEACLRMRPDRILLAELRAEEAFEYLRNVNSGHPGSITSVHAGSCALAFEQLVLLVKQSAAGRELSRHDIKRLLYRLIDVVIQFGVEDGRRVIREIWYGPARRRPMAP